ncbi:MAG: SIMPL domain-containing protein [Methanomicrobiales archaeon]|nr:SIMPL domain-containing protein [Methanomicrobiales archaeon]
MDSGANLPTMMQKAILGVLATILVLITILGSVMAAQDTVQPLEKLIHTSATGEVLTQPDQVEISVSVQTENQDAKVTQQRNADIMTKTIAALENAGIPPDKIKTTGYNMYQVSEDSTQILGQKIKLYRVTNTLLVTLTDISRAGEILDLAVAGGVNQVNYITFSLSKAQLRALRSQALNDSMAQAWSDADTVASAACLVVAGVKEITISGGYYPIPMTDYYSAGSEKSVTPVIAGDVKVTATVSVTYLCG